MDIVIIAEFCSNFNENNNGRFKELCDLLTKENKIEIITSSFSHIDKKQKKDEKYNLSYKITNIYEPGYKKNICLKRLYSHMIWGNNVYKYLLKREKPNIIYCAIPSLTAAEKVAEYSKKNNIKFIVDIQDLWPEAFQMVFNISILKDILFYPMKRKADKIYRSADKIVAVSNTYRDRGLKVNNKDNKGLTVFLGTDLNFLYDSLSEQDITYTKRDNEIWLGYLGTIGSSYDIKTALMSTKKVQEKYNNVKLILLGDGPLLEKYKNIAINEKVNAVFLGRKKYIEAMKIMEQCDIALNPLVRGAAQSIINKVGDYAALGLPVINSLQNKEYKDLLNEYKAGINIECENIEAMSKSIIDLIENNDLRVQMGLNNKKLANDKFDRSKTYEEIINLINSN